MRTLFVMDAGDYDPALPQTVRPSVRAVVIRQGRVCMVHSRKYDYYKFPGGGMEPGEDQRQTLLRETAEEAGLAVCPDTVQEYGQVRRVRRNDEGGPFVQENYYYLCEAQTESIPQQLDDYEADEGFTPEWIEPEAAIRVNREQPHGPKDQQMLEREALVLERLIREGYFE